MSLSVVELERRLQTALNGALVDRRVPGAIATVRAPTIDLHWTSAAGHDGPDDLSPLDPSRPFRLASTTKMFVAAAAWRLIEDGSMRLCDAVKAWALPGTCEQLIGGAYDPEAITLGHLLAHTSGLRDHATSEAYPDVIADMPHRRWTRSEQIGLAMQLGPPLAPAGAAFQYSDTGYVILGEMIEQATGQDIGAAVRKGLDFAALGLDRTYWEVLELDPAGNDDRLRQYVGDVDATDFHPSFDMYGGGGLVSTIDDMAVFVRELIQGRVFKRATTLPAALLVPPARRAGDAQLHSRLARIVRMGTRLGWGHPGFWGCGAFHCAEADLTIALSINQGRPEDPNLLLDLLGLLAETVLPGR